VARVPTQLWPMKSKCQLTYHFFNVCLVPLFVGHLLSNDMILSVVTRQSSFAVRSWFHKI
jgi:hypothetical protein